MNPTDNKENNKWQIYSNNYILQIMMINNLITKLYKFFFATCVACTKINQVMNFINNYGFHPEILLVTLVLSWISLPTVKLAVSFL